ncbi:hypothetical protein ACFWR5_31535, partial [Streptomyces sp. NPDC058613]
TRAAGGRGTRAPARPGSGTGTAGGTRTGTRPGGRRLCGASRRTTPGRIGRPGPWPGPVRPVGLV